MLIKDILDSDSKIALLTCPRRFDKTLNMSMLKRYFEKNEEDNSYLFDGFAILGAGEKYKSYMRKYPVISISFKSVDQPDFETAFSVFKEIISDEFRCHGKLLISDILFESNKKRYLDICNCQGDYSVYVSALKFLSNRLYEFYNKKIIILIDEYDVPLQSAYFNGYYDNMIKLIHSVFESVLGKYQFQQYYS